MLGVGLAVWWIPLLAVIAWRGRGDVLTQEALFFSTAAMVTFGGAYAVLAYVNQAAVYRFGWLAPADVAAGLGLAESTPGPLIMVTQFIGFLAAYRNHGDLQPVVAGVIGSMVTVWATFAPCFLWIFLGAPYVERLRTNRRLGAALGGGHRCRRRRHRQPGPDLRHRGALRPGALPEALLHTGPDRRGGLDQTLLLRRGRRLLLRHPATQVEPRARDGRVRRGRVAPRPRHMTSGASWEDPWNATSRRTGTSSRSSNARTT